MIAIDGRMCFHGMVKGLEGCILYIYIYVYNGLQRAKEGRDGRGGTAGRREVPREIRYKGQ